MFFHASTFAGSRESCFEHKPDRPSVQHHPMDPASVNAIKHRCVIVILAHFTLFQPNLH